MSMAPAAALEEMTTTNEDDAGRMEMTPRPVRHKQFASMLPTDRVFNRSTVLKVVVTVSAACFLVVMAHRSMADDKLWSAESNTREIERGRYLGKIMGCNDCHTAGYAAAGGKIPESHWLPRGTVGWRGPSGTHYPAHFRLVTD